MPLEGIKATSLTCPSKGTKSRRSLSSKAHTGGALGIAVPAAGIWPQSRFESASTKPWELQVPVREGLGELRLSCGKDPCEFTWTGITYLEAARGSLKNVTDPLGILK